MRDEYGLSISYIKDWRLREKTYENLRGKPDKSYALLLSFIYMLKIINPRLVVELKIKENHSFLYVLIVVATSVNG